MPTLSASTSPTPIGTLKFRSPINLEGSWGSRPLAKRATSYMTLYFSRDNTGWIEWEIPGLGMYEEIGLTFDITADGRRVLSDYDGVMSFPDQAVTLLEKHGVDCSYIRNAGD